MSGFSVHLDIVSLEETLFSEQVKFVSVRGEMGELGIHPGHAPLLTTIKPGQVIVQKQNGDEELFFVSGGMLEVQPSIVTILADVASRAEDLDEARAIQAEEKARANLANKQSDIDYSRALAELAEASAQIRAISELKRQLKRGRK